MLLKSLDLPSSRSAAGAVGRILPQIEKCLPHSFWPVTLEDLRSFVANTSESGEVEDFLWKAEHRLPVEVLKRFPREYRLSDGGDVLILMPSLPTLAPIASYFIRTGAEQMEGKHWRAAVTLNPCLPGHLPCWWCCPNPQNRRH
mmetsp:Transcript_164842/g.528979  ORF Transcript_164842/g.528979 Transcript_164842/m.528979 type:complete len:144 (-) Transcript_164842:567-998(-)